MRASFIQNMTPETLFKIYLPQAIEDYGDEIFNRLFETESGSTEEYQRHPQTEVKEKMRAILVDWLVEVYLKLSGLETLLSGRKVCLSFCLVGKYVLSLAQGSNNHLRF